MVKQAKAGKRTEAAAESKADARAAGQPEAPAGTGPDTETDAQPVASDGDQEEPPPDEWAGLCAMMTAYEQVAMAHVKTPDDYKPKEDMQECIREVMAVRQDVARALPMFGEHNAIQAYWKWLDRDDKIAPAAFGAVLCMAHARHLLTVLSVILTDTRERGELVDLSEGITREPDRFSTEHVVAMTNQAHAAIKAASGYIENEDPLSVRGSW